MPGLHPRRIAIVDDLWRPSRQRYCGQRYSTALYVMSRSMNSIVLSGLGVKVISPISGPPANLHTTCAEMLGPFVFRSRIVQTPTLDTISCGEMVTLALG